MSGNPEHAITACEKFQQRLPSLIEAGEGLYRDHHLNTCALCRALVVDLETIAEAARDLFGPQR
jgi:hypothetical protein